MTRRRAEIWLSLIVCAAYVICGQLVENAYPFSSFPMYARVAQSRTRILAKSASGTASDVDQYTEWQCPAFSPTDCITPGDETVGYRDRDALRFVKASRTTSHHPREPVLLIRRIYHFTPAVEQHDCVLASCTAERR